jgi:hypothetical protein
MKNGPAAAPILCLISVNSGTLAAKMAMRRYDAFATFLSKSTFRFKAMTRPSTPSRSRIEWNSERCLELQCGDPLMLACAPDALVYIVT